MRCVPILHNDLQVDLSTQVYTNDTWQYLRISSSWMLNCENMTFGTGMPKIIFLLPTKEQNYHLKYCNAQC